MIEDKVIKKRSTFRLEYSHKINIKANSYKIWQLLTDTVNYTNWNSTLTSLKGDMSLGGKIELMSPDVPGKVFSIKVKEFIPNKWMLWANGFPLTLRVKRSFLLTEQKDGSTNFEMKESFSGLLVPAFVNKLPDLTPMFNHFENDLKKAVKKNP